MSVIDRLFVNGRVWTADAAQPQAEALAVAGDTIVAVGSTAQMRALAPPGADVIDLEGRRVVPGFIDAHWHLLPGSAATFYMADSLAEFQRRLRALADADPGRGWIVDSGWAYTDFPDDVPHRRWIDAVVNDRPVWITGRDGHMVLGNTLALQTLGIADARGASTNISVVRDAQGALTGELRGMDELERIKTLLPVATAAQIERLLRDVQAQANAFGVTSVHNLEENFGVDLDVFQRARAEGWLSLRVRQAHRLLPEPNAERLALLDERRRATAGDNMFSFAGLKGWLDGTIDARTAFMREPLTDGSAGAPYWDAHLLNAAVATMDRHGWQVMLHATGDGSIGQAIDAYENAARVNGPRSLGQERRHRIEHIDIPTAQDLARCARAGIVASPQPNFAYPDDTVVHNYSGLLGPKRTALAQSFRTIDEAGVRQCFSSDYPVSSMDVLRSVHTAVSRTRRDRAGAAPWTPHERIGVEAALRHFTVDAAYAEFDEHRTGRLAPGLLADLVVLSDDIFDDPERDLLGSHVLMTVLGGRIVHETTRAAASTRAQACAPMLRPRSACPACRGASLDPRLLATRASNRERWHRHA